MHVDAAEPGRIEDVLRQDAAVRDDERDVDAFCSRSHFAKSPVLSFVGWTTVSPSSSALALDRRRRDLEPAALTACPADTQHATTSAISTERIEARHRELRGPEEHRAKRA